MSSLLVRLSLALVAFNLLLTLAVVGNRFVTAHFRRRYIATVARIKPLVLAWIDGDDVDLDFVGEERKALTELLSRYGRAMHGEARDALAGLSQRLGISGEIQAGLLSRAGWKRAAAAYRLGDIGADATTELIVALSDKDRRVRNAATRSLGRLEDPAAVEPLVLALARGEIARAVGGQALLDIGVVAAPKLDRLLLSPEPSVRAVAAELLGRMAVGHSPLLAAAIDDPTPIVRVAVARALGRLGSRSAANVLPELLDDPVAFVRAATASAIADLGLREHLPRLLQMARDDDFLPAGAAARAVGLLDPDVLVASGFRFDASPHLREAIDLLEVRAP